MRDIRLLKLFKQHYQDCFDIPLDVKYSSFGYYDGFEIVQAASEKSKLFTMDTESPTSILYYGAGKEISNIDIGKSMQIIGVFRCENDLADKKRSEEFWELSDKLPYFAVGFLKVQNDTFANASKKVEEICDMPFDCKEAAGCRCLVCFTYDNADLIVFLAGNSMSCIMKKLQEIESLPSFSYMHNIFGIAEKYLKAIKTTETSLEVWENVNCNINEEIKQIEMKFVTSGDKENIRLGLKKVFDESNQKHKIKNYEKMTYTYISGHENLLLKIEETDVKSFLTMLIPGGVLTHQNLMYQNGVYNIETSVYIQESMWSEVLGDIELKNKRSSVGWCKRLIDKYSQYMSKEFAYGDEGFHSYFQSLVLTLNTLNQYEKFGVSSEIFFMIYPALKLFDNIFVSAYETLGGNRNDNYDQIKKLKYTLRKFISCVNSIIYHTIHTDQVFLMIPGYSGTPYSIPIKLNIMYEWVVNTIKDILNDENIDCQCILVPEMEAVPKSYLFDFGIETKDRLIYVYFSQRTLFLPRSLMIILAHEMGHYVGKEIRLRKQRWKHILRLMSRCIVSGILHGVRKIDLRYDDEKHVFNLCKKKALHELYTKIHIFLDSYCTKELKGDYHGDKVAIVLKRGIYQMLTLENSEIERAIQTLPAELETRMEKFDEFIKYNRLIYKIQSAMKEEMKFITYSGWLEQTVDLVMSTFREVFSDMVAVNILECEFEDFLEAYQVSEGLVISEDNVSGEQCMRELAVNQVIFNRQEDDKSHRHGFGIKQTEPYVLNNFFGFEWARREIIQYANACHKEIAKRLDQENCKDQIEKIRTLFSLFKNRNKNGYDVQKGISDVNMQYIQNVKKEYEKTNEI